MSLILDGDGAISGLTATGISAVQTIPSSSITQAMLQTLVVPLGVGQTWQDVSASRSAGVTYTNSTGRPIVVSIRAQTGTSDCSITVDSVQAAQALQTTATRNFLTAVVPNGSTYIMQPSFSGLWSELR